MINLWGLLESISFISSSKHSTSAFQIQRISSCLFKYNPILGSDRSVSVLTTPSSLQSSSMVRSSLHDGYEDTAIIEVEQKFCSSNLKQVQSQLSRMGFESSNTSINFVDWYFDSPDLLLCTQDCWLRYRHLSDDLGVGVSGWQLKKGRRINSDQMSGSSATSTVYEELDGISALELADSLITKKLASAEDGDVKVAHSWLITVETMDAFPTPEHPLLKEHSIQPFARFETIRSSWKSVDECYKDITVDLDETDYGYTVGEVETIVSSDKDVDNARSRVQSVIKEITGDDSSRAIGKLEKYLIDNRPEIYDACVKSGSMKD